MTTPVIYGAIAFLNNLVAISLFLLAHKLGNRKGRAAVKIALVLVMISTVASLSASYHAFFNGPISSIAVFLSGLISCFTIAAIWQKSKRFAPEFLLALSTIFLGVQAIINHAASPDINGHYSSFLAIHITASVMGQFFAICSSIVSFLYLRQWQILKEKKLDKLLKGIPALDVLERILTSSLYATSAFLTIAVLSGIYFFFTDMASSHSYILKLIWAMVIWLWYGIALCSRFVKATPVILTARFSFIGLLLLTAAFYGFVFTLGES